MKYLYYKRLRKVNDGRHVQGKIKNTLRSFAFTDYIIAVEGLFSDTSKFRQLPTDPTPTRLSTLQNYLSKLLNRGEISESEYSLLRPKHAHVGRAHAVLRYTSNTPHCLNLDLL